MPMSVSLSASTTGYDDAETIAQVLEHCAAMVRAGGGEFVEKRGTFYAVTAHAADQAADFSLSTGP